MTSQHTRLTRIEKTFGTHFKVEMLEIQPDLRCDGADPDCRRVTITSSAASWTLDRHQDESLIQFAVRAEDTALKRGEGTFAKKLLLQSVGREAEHEAAH